jgi:hypothetical protein
VAVCRESNRNGIEVNARQGLVSRVESDGNPQFTMAVCLDWGRMVVGSPQHGPFLSWALFAIPNTANATQICVRMYRSVCFRKDIHPGHLGLDAVAPIRDL